MLRKTKLMRILSALTAAVLLCLSTLCYGTAEPQKDCVGTDISAFQSLTFAGDPVDGSIFAGSKLTVINIWQRWCGPCWAELPYFQQMHEYYSATPEADVCIWGALYYGDNPDTIQQAIDFVADHGFTWDQMLMCDTLLAAINENNDEYVHIPQTLIVDRYGIIRAQVVGKVDSYEELYELTDTWLNTLNEEYAASEGDVDGSGAVSVTDALLALRHAMSIITLDSGAILRGDLNGDGLIDATDAILILRAVIAI